MQPQAYSTPPANQTGNLGSMNLRELVGAWRANMTMKANNTLSGYQQRNAQSFTDPTPPPYAKSAQYLTVSNLTATHDVREVQYANTPASPSDSLNVNDTGTGYYAQVAMQFRLVDTANLTGIWMYYSSSGAANLNIVNSSTNSGDKPPSGSPTIATFTLPADLEDWHFVKFNNQVTLRAGFYYWIVVNATSMNKSRVHWFYIADTGGSEDNKCAAVYSGGWLNEANIHTWFPYLNLMLMLDVLPVDPSKTRQVRTYNSPSLVAMNETNTNTQLLYNTTLIPNVLIDTFALVVNTSVTFAVNWTVGFYIYNPVGAPLRYVAHNGWTQWIINFTSGAEPSPTAYPYTWFMRAFQITPISPFWNDSSHQPAIWVNRSYSPTPSFSMGVGPTSYIVWQNDNLNTDPWNAKWGITTKSTFKVDVSVPSKVVVGLPLIISMNATPYTQGYSNISFYTLTDRPYSRIVYLYSTTGSVTLSLNETGLHNLFLFYTSSINYYDVSLNESLTVSVLPVDCNVTLVSINSPILGNPATAQFRFLNGTNGWTPMAPNSVRINGTDTPFTYSGGVTTVSWTTLSGAWRSGTNHVNITVINGIFLNATVCPLTILPPDARLSLDATSYAATYGDNVLVSFSFLNMTSGGTQFPSPPTLYMNGTEVSFPSSLIGGLYTYTLSTRYFSAAGVYHLNFTAVCRTFVATNITSVDVSKLVMVMVLHLDETSVTAGSSLSAHATLRYPNSTFVEDHTRVTFVFTVTFANSTIRAFDVMTETVGGNCTASFPTTDQMKEISVEAVYAGDAVRTSASVSNPQVLVTPPVSGLPVWMIVIAGVSGAAVVVAVVAAVVRRRHGRESEERKTAVLRQTASLAQLVVVDLKSGRCVFSRSLGTEENVDPNLISGFLSANQSILEEVFKKKSKTGLRFADYGDYKVISHVGDYIMVTLFATEAAGEELTSVLEKFTDKFEKAYGESLKSWDGDMCAFKDAEDITDEVFALQLTSPYMLLDDPKAKLSKNERAAVHFSRILSAERGVFFMPRVIDFLLTKQSLKRGEAMDAINSLTKKGMFRQLTVEQAAQVVKSVSEKASNQE